MWCDKYCRTAKANAIVCCVFRPVVVSLCQTAGVGGGMMTCFFAA